MSDPPQVVTAAFRLRRLIGATADEVTTLLGLPLADAMGEVWLDPATGHAVVPGPDGEPMPAKGHFGPAPRVPAFQPYRAWLYRITPDPARPEEQYWYLDLVESQPGVWRVVSCHADDCHTDY